MQRFVSEIKSKTGENHFSKVLKSASLAALKYDRTLAVMYDLSGMNSMDADIIISDWKTLMQQYGFDKRSQCPNYLLLIINLWLPCGVLDLMIKEIFEV